MPENAWAGSSVWYERPTCTKKASFAEKSLNWSDFRKWLEKNFSYNYAKDSFNYAKRFYHVLFSGDGSILLEVSEGLRKTVMASLSNLSKFLGVYEDWERLVKAYGLKWSCGKAEDLLISRMVNVDKNGEVLKWVRLVKVKVPQLSVFMDFITFSGLRLREALNSWNLIIELAKQGKLSQYYNKDKKALEHFRFKRLFIRRSKKTFATFIPEWLVERVSKQEKLTEFQVNNWVRRDNRLKSRFSDIREFWATFMTKWLNPAEIDFLQGRVSGSVFMRNYFNPALISDLKERVFKGISEIQSKL